MKRTHFSSTLNSKRGQCHIFLQPWVSPLSRWLPVSKSWFTSFPFSLILGRLFADSVASSLRVCDRAVCVQNANYIRRAHTHWTLLTSQPHFTHSRFTLLRGNSLRKLKWKNQNQQHIRQSTSPEEHTELHYSHCFPIHHHWSSMAKEPSSGSISPHLLRNSFSQVSLADLGPSREEGGVCWGEEEAGKFSNPWGSGNFHSRPCCSIPVIPDSG